MKPIKYLAVAAAALVLACCIFTGCSTLDPNADPLVVRVEQTESLAKPAFDMVLKVEYSNIGYFRTNAPEFYGFCEWLKQPTPISVQPSGKYTNATLVPVTLPRCSAMLWDINIVKNDYKAGKASGGVLGAALATLQSTLNHAQAWMIVLTNQPALTK